MEIQMAINIRCMFSNKGNKRNCVHVAANDNKHEMDQ